MRGTSDEDLMLFNHEVAASHDVTFRVTDSQGAYNTDDASGTITMQDGTEVGFTGVEPIQ